ncbi:MAG: NADH dehydrogenase (quinone) subunit D [Acidihalobacter sp.]|jgi:NADH dehydrogenase I D subunit
MNAPATVNKEPQVVADRILDVREVRPDELIGVLEQLKQGSEGIRYEMLFDISAVDDAGRGGGFTVFYHLVSLSSNRDLRLEVRLADDSRALPTATPVWPSANWYEREVYDLFGLSFDGHPDLRRILLPVYWEGHPLRKSYPGRATEHGSYSLPPERYRELMATYQVADTRSAGEREDEYILNIGPNHPGTHGILRLIARMRGETIIALDPDIGFHHRGAEKIAERHTYHNYIPYCDRIDYLAGVANELPYVMAVEQLAGIEVPERAVVMRVLLTELSRINAHLVWLASYGHDLGVMGPAFYCFSVREKLFDVLQLITGGRMHPAFFRIGGVAMDMPEGWREALDPMLDAIEGSMGEFCTLTIDNPIFQARTSGNGQYTQEQAIEWGFTGPNLRCTGLAWDLRKTRPYCGYEEYDFEVPTATEGDALSRTRLRIEEIRQSLRIVRQAADRLPEGPVLSDKARFAFARKERTLEDIETLIHHFVGTGRGMGFPEGDAFFCTEAPKGMMGFYVVSDGSANPYRVRIRTPSFAHVQAFSWLSTGGQLGDLIPMIGSMDYVLADLDR